MSDSRDVIHFAARLLELIPRAETTASYKYALLTALIELAAERRGDGFAAGELTTRKVAERVLELYWPQAQPFSPQRTRSTPRVLRQISGEKRAIVDHIAEYRATRPRETGTPTRARMADEAGFRSLLDKIERILIRYPLPLLQRLGGESLQLIYTINWDETIADSKLRRHQRRYDPANADAENEVDFDNRVLLLPNVERWLAELAPLFLPLIRREWTQFVARRNRDILAEVTLERFLFEPSREQLRALCPDLAQLQDRRCFYCGERLQRSSEVDHFLAWSRCGASSVENLVVAHDRCNNSKSDYLVAARHLEHWTTRLVEQAMDLEQIALKRHWPSEPRRIGALVCSNYGALNGDTRLWLAQRTWVPARSQPIAEIHAQLAGWLQKSSSS